jgi:hypothetical protein
VPFFFLIVYLFDAFVYAVFGYWIGKCLRLLPEKRSWVLLLPSLLMYASDRFLSAILILGIPFSGRLFPIWRFLVEIVIILLALVALRRGWSAL